MIRNNTYAELNGKQYRVLHPSTGEYLLCSNDNKDLMNGFYQSPAERELITVSGLKFKVPVENYENTYLRPITKEDNVQIYRINTYGVYKGHEFPVEGETETTYWLRADQWSDWVEKLDFIRQDRDDITKEVPKSEVDPVYERKTPLPDFFNY